MHPVIRVALFFDGYSSSLSSRNLKRRVIAWLALGVWGLVLAVSCTLQAELSMHTNKTQAVVVTMIATAACVGILLSRTMVRLLPSLIDSTQCGSMRLLVQVCLAGLAIGPRERVRAHERDLLRTAHDARTVPRSTTTAK